ncbi:MAG: class I SAM-dependent methyltransferase [Anaerolineae bacterium]
MSTNGLKEELRRKAEAAEKLSRHRKKQDFVSQYQAIYGEECIACGNPVVDSKLLFENVLTDTLDNRCSVFVCGHCDLGVTYPVLSEDQCLALYDEEYVQLPTGELNLTDVPPEDLFPARGFAQRVNKWLYHDVIPPVFCQSGNAGSLLRKILFSRLSAKFFIGWPNFYRPGGERQAKPKFLDCGTGRGWFLALFPKDSDYEARGIDINPAAVAFCQRLGLSVSQASLQDLEENDFAFIRLWHVLEHVADPLTFLRVAHEHLGQDGVLILGLPHFNPWPYALSRSLLGVTQWMHLPYHRFHWNLRNIQLMLRRNNFEVLAANSKSSGAWKTQNLVQHWKANGQAREIPRSISNLLQIVWFLVDIPLDYLNGGDTMEIYARKT